MKKYSIIILAILSFLFISSNSFALSIGDLGTQITINDGQANSTWGGGSQALGIAGEDNETEGSPNTYTYQSWDLEGMFWNASTSKLFIIGGFNYLSGQVTDGISHIEYTGDIFIGSNYVLDLSRASSNYLTSIGTYNIIENYTSVTEPHDVLTSAPLAYSVGGTNVGTGSYSAYQITDWTGINLFEPWRESANGAWTNDTHYALEVNLSGTTTANLINAGNLIHLTLSCGNDTIEGKVAPVPEPATMLLFGTGLVGLAGIGRKKFRKS
jgi:hypothetical protein